MTLPAPTISNLTEGPISKAIFRLALPVVLGMCMEVALATTDYYWVGRLGPVAQDAITSAMVIMWTIWAAISVVSIGITALVARYAGARAFRRVTYVVRQGLILSLIVGAAVTVGGLFSSRMLVTVMEASPATLALAVPYLNVFFGTALLYFWAETIYATFRAAGDTRTPTIVAGIGVLLNLGLDPLLIFGLGPIPAMGVIGAAIATAIAKLLTCLIMSWLLFRNRLPIPTRISFVWRPRLHTLLKIARIGFPLSAQQVAFVVVYWFLIRFVHTFGNEAGAAMGIGNRMESLSYLTCHGFALAAATLVGQNLGAGRPDRAARSAWGAMAYSAAITGVMTALFLTVPKGISGLFTTDPLVIEMAAEYLFILGLSQVAMSVEIVLEGSFSGAGDTVPLMAIMMPGWLVRIPLAYYLAFTLGWGLAGIWWTLTITSIAKSIALAIWFGTGRWKRKKL